MTDLLARKEDNRRELKAKVLLVIFGAMMGAGIYIMQLGVYQWNHWIAGFGGAVLLVSCFFTYLLLKTPFEEIKRSVR